MYSPSPKTKGHCCHKVTHGLVSSMCGENAVMIEVCVLCIIALNSDFVEVHTNSPSRMVSREGLEPPILWFVAIRFLRLSYRDITATVSSVAPAAFWISSITRVLILRSQHNASASVLNLKLIGLQTSPAMAEWTGLEPATRISEHMISNHADYQLSHHSIRC